MTKDDLNPLSKVLLGVVSARFGPGAIGRIGTIANCGIVVLAVLAVGFAFVNIYVSGAIAVLVAALAFYAVHRAFQYADAHPELAAMDGAQISRVLTQQASMRQLDGIPPPPPFIEGAVQNPLLDNMGEEK